MGIGAAFGIKIDTADADSENSTLTIIQNCTFTKNSGQGFIEIGDLLKAPKVQLLLNSFIENDGVPVRVFSGILEDKGSQYIGNYEYGLLGGAVFQSF